MVVYIAGKMAGLPDKGMKAFEDGEHELRKMGFDVILNPHSLPDGMPGDRYMPICLAMVNAADVLVLLDGWEDSPGARLEKAFAEYQGKKVFTLLGIGKRVLEWHVLLKAHFPNLPCQTFEQFIMNAGKED